MDWNNDGKIDGHDYVFYKTVIESSDSDSSDNSSSSSDGGSYIYSTPKKEPNTNHTGNNIPGNTNTETPGCVTWAIVGIIIFLVIKFIAG